MNIHSLQLHFDELKLMLQLLDFKFDIIALSETKIEKDKSPIIDISLEGYHKPVGTPTESTKGGVLIYVSDKLNFKPRNDLNIYESKKIESMFIEIINSKNANSIVGTVYRHPCMQGDEFNDDHLKSLTDKLNNEDKQCFLAGDFNFDLLKASTDSSTSDFFDTLTSNFLLPMISLPTKINTVNDTLIDNIFTNQFLPDTISGNITVGISDHLPSFVIIPNPNQRHLPKKNNIYRRNYQDFDRENFLLDLLDIDWGNVLEIQKNDPNKSFDNFYESIENILNLYAPLKKVSNKEHKRTYKPWITNGIITSIKRRNKLFNSYVKCKNLLRKHELHVSYKTLRNFIQTLIKTSKMDFYKSYFSNNNKNLRKVWEGIKTIINNKNKSFDSPTCLTQDDESITDPIEISNEFNQYFSKIADSILDKRKYHGNKSYSDFLIDPSPNSINDSFDPTNEEEIYNIISKMKSNKSCGPTSIPTKILKLIQFEICKPLAEIINLSFSTGIHPEKLKIAHVKPLFKKGSKLLMCNYRPISLLSNLNRIFEQVMFTRVYEFLENSKSFYSLQFGFRKKHSTTHAIIDIIEKINQSLDKEKIACGVFVDFQKAFDTVNHDILLKKLSHLGIKGNINEWFKSYLFERKQFVSVLGYKSNLATLNHGVPQGSVLGPLLFLIYINDLNKAIKNSTVFHFADDTNLLQISNSYEEVAKKLNKDLKNLHGWLLANKISLNAAKTEIIFFKKPRSLQPPPTLKIKLDGIRIHPTSSVKYLGLFLDENLSGITHCQQLLPKLRRANGILAKTRHFVPRKEMLSIYYSIFSSHLLYGCQAWGQHANQHLKKIETLQNNALRLITFSEFNAHVSPLYKSLKILKLKDQITLQNCLLVLDQLNKNIPSNFSDFFITTKDLYSSVTTRVTRNSKKGKLYVPRVNSVRYGRRSIKQSCILSWNHIIDKFPNTDFTKIQRNDLKRLITESFINLY